VLVRGGPGRLILPAVQIRLLRAVGAVTVHAFVGLALHLAIVAVERGPAAVAVLNGRGSTRERPHPRRIEAFLGRRANEIGGADVVLTVTALRRIVVGAEVVTRALLRAAAAGAVVLGRVVERL